MSRYEYKDEYNGTLIVYIGDDNKVMIVTSQVAKLRHAQPVLLTHDQAREVAVKMLEELGKSGDVKEVVE